MKLVFSLNQVLIAAILVAGSFGLTALFSQFEGLVDMQCSAEGCRVVIDGRS